MINDFIQSLVGTVKKAFTYSGRATRKEFWIYTITSTIVSLILLVFTLGMGRIHEVLGYIFLTLWLLIYIALLLPYFAVLVRRLHDIDLSGFYIWYLSPIGLPIIYVIYLLGVDATCDKLIERNNKIGSCWLGWILTWLLWPIGSTAALPLLCLFAGKNEANSFGESPYTK